MVGDGLSMINACLQPKWNAEAVALPVAASPSARQAMRPTAQLPPLAQKKISLLAMAYCIASDNISTTAKRPCQSKAHNGRMFQTIGPASDEGSHAGEKQGRLEAHR